MILEIQFATWTKSTYECCTITSK